MTAVSSAHPLRTALGALRTKLLGTGDGLPRVRTPSVLQMEAVECGAASLCMILAYYGKHVPLEELRYECGVSRDGSKASHIVRAARRYGLHARGLRAEADHLRNMHLPCIIFWNFNHFLVLEGFAPGKVLLNDPAMGRRSVSDEEFDQAFTGVVLDFEPSPLFEPSGRRRTLAQSLRKRMTGGWTALAYLVLTGLALVVPSLLAPVFQSVYIDRVLVGGLDGWARPLIVAMIVSSVVVAALTWLQRHYLLKLENRIAISTSASFFWHVLRLPVRFYHQRSAGDIGARVGINDSVAKILSQDVVAGLLSIITALFFAFIMLFYDVAMSLITIGIVCVNLLVLRYVSGRRTELNQKVSIDRGKVIGTSMNGLMLIETLKASGTETDFFCRWAGFQARLMNSLQEMSRTSIILELLPKFLTATNTAVILGAGGLRVMRGEMSIGTLVAYQALVASFVNPTNALIALGGKIQNFQGEMDRLDDVSGHESENIAAERNTEPLAAAKLEGHLELRNVTFGYSRLAPPLLENFSLTLKAGQRVALVGSSGCGKSTLSKLVLGLYEPWEGDILFDGRPKAAWPRQQWLNSVAAVDQDIALFSGTIADNLSMWDGTVTPPVMVRAAKDACVHDIVTARPGGYDGLVAEGGANFSGGQRQRLEIARALTSNPRLLVLDEATSALDPVTEAAIDANIRRRGCSCLIVAHRLSTVRDCDEIIVLDKGKVVERGTHDELVALGGHFARLIAHE